MRAASASDELVGRTLGEFVLRERIGEGGYGAVYRAHQPALDREAVVKVLHPRLQDSQAAMERFLREAKLASKLDHPFAAHIYAFGAEPEGLLWIAMELVRGTSLDRILKLHGPLPLERLVPLFDRICEVVHSAHEKGIIHRDIKPANVMVLARSGRLLPKLLDFGIAKGLAASPEPMIEYAPPTIEMSPPTPPPDDEVGPAATAETFDLTQRGAIIGSPSYMAPEQWADAGQVDARTDLYALGILAYECLTGLPPFSGDTISLIAMAHENQPVPPLRHPRFPSALDAVFAKVLAKQPDRRYPDALAFATAFRNAAGIGLERPSLPKIEQAVCDRALAFAPQPIAEAVASLDGARNAHQARDAVAQIARTIARYLGLLALACRSRVAADEDPEVARLLRELHRRSLSDAEWLELARLLTKPWRDRRDAYPIPELVGALEDQEAIATLESLASLREREVPEAELPDLLFKAVARVGAAVAAIDFLEDYPLVVMVDAGEAEHWMGVRRSHRKTTSVRGKGLAVDSVALIDRDGAPVLALSPLLQAVAPTPGAQLEMFMLDGRDPRGAKLVALPSGFENHDTHVWDWMRAQLADSLHDSDDHLGEEKPPYRGLQAFSADDGLAFIGREKQVDAFVNRLQLQPLLAVVGRSGAGKSSFVQAGVIPALPTSWRAITMRPGPSPINALLSRLEFAKFAPISRDAIVEDVEALGKHLRSDAERHGPLLVVVDQLEEIFTLCEAAAERRAFAEALAAAARSPVDPVRVVFTLRDDFLVRTEQMPALRNRIGQGLQLLTVPAAEDLLRILIEPARRAGYEFEDPALPAEMVEEVADQPGALPLISFTAAKLWELRDRQFKQLRRAAYTALGGVGGALARHADVTLDAMPPEERALAREAFRHLVTTQNTRAVLTRKDLRQLLGAGEHADRVVEQLVAARLLVASENESGAETIEIVHEALLATWPRLVAWRHEDAEGAHFREQLRSAAEQWQQRARAKGLLWRGDALADFSRWRARHPGPLTDIERAFTNASLADAARGRRNRTMLLAGAFTVLVGGVVALVVLNTNIASQRMRAETANAELNATLQHQYEAQGRRLVLGGEPLQALAYLAKAAEYGARGRAYDFLVAEAIRDSSGELFEVRHALPVNAAAFSPDGQLLATAGYDRTARIVDATTGAQRFVLEHSSPVRNVTFSPDGTTVLTRTNDKTAVLWDVRTGKRLHELPHGASVSCAAYTHDGSLAITAGVDGALVAWDLSSGEKRWTASSGSAPITTCSLSSNGKAIATGDRKGTLRIWDVETGQLERDVRGPPHGARVMRFVGDRDELVVTSYDGSASIWNATTGAIVLRLASESALNDAEPSPDGRLVATASDDHTVTLWDSSTGRRVHVLAAHAAEMTAVAFSPDGAYLVGTSEDSTASLWETATARLLARWRGHEDGVTFAAFAKDAKRVVTTSNDGRAIVWDVRPQESATWLVGHGAAIYTDGFSPDGTRIVTASEDRTARVWDAASGRSLAVLRHDSPVYLAVFSPDGRTIATGAADGNVRLWDTKRGVVQATLTSGGPVTISQLAWSPDGSLLAAASDDGVLRCWEIAMQRVRFEHREAYALRSVSFNATGSEIVVSGDDPAIHVWSSDGRSLHTYRDADSDLHLSAELDRSDTRMLVTYSKHAAKIIDLDRPGASIELQGHVGLINYAAWSPDGGLAVTASADGTARVWDTSTGAMLAILAHAAPVTFATFSPDGKRVAVVGRDGTGSIHELPEYRGSAAELAHVMRCRVRYEVRGEGVVPRPPDPSCGAAR